MAYDVTGTVKVARDVEDASLAMTFVVTEDFVEIPYRQTNNFNTSPGCPEFSGKGNPVNMLFHDVAQHTLRLGRIRQQRALPRPLKQARNIRSP